MRLIAFFQDTGYSKSSESAKNEMPMNIIQAIPKPAGK
jgi:hypothetical protein